MKTIYWYFTVDKDVPPSRQTSAHFVVSTINSILQDPRGWVRFGYSFVQRTEQVTVDHNIVLVRLSTESTVYRKCNFSGLSCAAQGPEGQTIYINLDRWLYGSKASGLNLTDYRTYCVLHEFGHILGRGHAQCSRDANDPCPVMYQQTVSKGCCAPNPWPLLGE